MYPKLDSDSLRTLAKIKSYLSGAELFFAGGCVRDALLDIPSKDFDIEVYGISKDDFEEKMESMGAEGVGKSFFVYRYKNFDISLPRVEQKVAVGHTGFITATTADKKVACKRRDFTVNSMLLGIESGELLDFYGGACDLRRKIIRATSKDSFLEDSLRVLRAMQFSARFGMRIEPLTLKMCEDAKLCDISTGRIFAEFEKMFLAKHQTIGAYYFFRLKIAKKLFDLDCSPKQFFTLSRELKKSLSFFDSPSPYLFLYHLFSIFRRNKNRFLDKIGAPKLLNRFFLTQPKVPNLITDRFLVGVSLKIPIREWLGSYKSGVKEQALRLGIWEKVYTPEVTYRQMIARGFTGGEISKNYKLELAAEIRRNFKGKK